MFKDSLFKKIEDKTNINKDTIISIANKLQNSDMKDKKVLNELIERGYHKSYGSHAPCFRIFSILDKILPESDLI